MMMMMMMMIMMMLHNHYDQTFVIKTAERHLSITAAFASHPKEARCTGLQLKIISNYEISKKKLQSVKVVKKAERHLGITASASPHPKEARGGNYLKLN